MHCQGIGLNTRADGFEISVPNALQDYLQPASHCSETGLVQRAGRSQTMPLLRADRLVLAGNDGHYINQIPMPPANYLLGK
ncbi:MAG: hypothetical protein GWN58_48100 [Anaerolineae bacterium]|nr:hypothetical protein [Anaerolineae bacterium]